MRYPLPKLSSRDSYMSHKLISELTPEELEARRIRAREYMKEYRRNGRQRRRSKKTYFAKHPEKRRAFLDRHTIRSLEKRAEITAWIRTFKKECCKCGYNKHPEILEFHHPDPKNKLESVTKLRDHSRDKILKEIQKCIVVCPNCHREIHLVGQYNIA